MTLVEVYGKWQTEFGAGLRQDVFSQGQLQESKSTTLDLLPCEYSINTLQKETHLL